MMSDLYDDFKMYFKNENDGEPARSRKDHWPAGPAQRHLPPDQRRTRAASFSPVSFLFAERPNHHPRENSRAGRSAGA